MKLKHFYIFVTGLLIAAILGVGIWFLMKNHILSISIRAPAGSEVLETAVPETPEAPENTPRIFTISMVGDCTLASSQYEDSFDAVIAEHGMDWPFGGTVNYLGNDEFTLANLECTFSDSALGSGVLFQFRAPAANAGILAAGSVECVTLANNHTDDFGQQGLTDTEAALDAANVEYNGPNEGKVFETANGLRIGVYCPGWLGLSEANVQSGIAQLQEMSTDVIIFAPHWGSEGSYQVSDLQQQFAHIAIDAGADIVCGTHPHVLQRIEEYNGKYIFYSLGNFSFGGNTQPRDRDTAIAQVTIREQADGSFALDGYSLIPCCLSSTDGVNDFRPVPYDVESEEYARAMSKLSGEFQGGDLDVDYSFLNN